VEARDVRWEEFEEADYEERIQLFYRTLDEPELLDDEQAFGMIEVLYRDTAKRNERDRFDALLQELCNRFPALYEADAASYHDWSIANALVSGRVEAAAELAVKMAERSGHATDGFFRVIDRLAYHGQLSTLLKILPVAISAVEESTEVLPWAGDELRVIASTFVILDYVEHFQEPDAGDETLLKDMERYIEVDSEKLTAYLGALTGKGQRSWTVDNFMQRGSLHGRAQEEQLFDNPFFLLCIEFLGFLRRHKDVPWAKGELGVTQIADYLRQRSRGKLEGRERSVEAFMPRRKKKSKAKPRSRVEHPLCPDLATLDRFMGRLLHSFNPQYYKAAITLELMPAWLNFLTSRGLLDEDLEREVLNSILPLKQSVINVLGDWLEDPTIGANIKLAWEAHGL
jgi:hypothetical protein